MDATANTGLGRLLVNVFCAPVAVRRSSVSALLLLVTCAMGCSRPPLNDKDAQGAIDQWLAARSQKEGLTGEILKQSYIDDAVERKESWGIEVSDAEYSQMQSKAPGTSTIKVLGIRELPAENRAIADLDLSGFAWRQGGQIRWTKLPGVAHFSYYSNGRWVLTSIEWEQGLLQDSPNVHVR